MKLQLRSSNKTSNDIAGALLRGSDMVAWLKEISSWELDPASLECYLIAEAGTNRPTAMLVIFLHPHRAKELPLLEPCIAIHQKLFIPANTELYPVVSEQELRTMLIWHRQVLHPTFGFTGFELKDQIELSSLFSFDILTEADWSFAHPGNAEPVPFTHIHVYQPNVQELFQQIQDEIGQKPLSEIKKEENNRNIFKKAIDFLKYQFVKALFKLLMAFRNSLAQYAVAAGQPGRLPDPQAPPHWLDKLLENLGKSLKVMNGKREKEIERLMKLFDKNQEEALQYALPLNAFYQNRGTHAQSNTLTRRSTSFNLGSLMGGQTSNVWDISNNFHSLRDKYLQAANNAIATKDFKKAAYIYAHLLGDFNAAANVLKQGGMYREAAALYKDHLKNLSAAASCFAEGGLYFDAIELYEETGKYEAAGDLYAKINQPEKANSAYCRFVNDQLSSNNYIEASRVMYDKMKRPDEARDMLLKGWDRKAKEEECLHVYFQIGLKEHPDQLLRDVQFVQRNYLQIHNESAFLNVLSKLNKQEKTAGCREGIFDVACEVIHSKAERNDLHGLYRLKEFLPEDKLLSSDSVRYVTQHAKPVPAKIVDSFKLTTDVEWQDVLWFRQQFVAVGVRNATLKFARGNWEGDIEYYTWPLKKAPWNPYRFIQDPSPNQRILLHSQGGEELSGVGFIPDNIFNLDFSVAFTRNLGVFAKFCLNGEGQICCVQDDVAPVLHTYNNQFQLLNTISLKADLAKINTTLLIESDLISDGKNFYAYGEGITTILPDYTCIDEELSDTVLSLVLSGILDNNKHAIAVCDDNAILYTTGPKGLTYRAQIPSGEFTQATFLSTDTFALYSHKVIRFYSFDKEYSISQIKRVPVAEFLIKVLPTTNLNQAALFFSKGYVKLIDYSPED
ncbi:hypothetical protein HHL16_04340 [Pseudoflavitalea sp. G-6-1-2]|uniref:hypothetical protein n=1 Tax=Pseudoflavitalea sp. G-6-1-2 TaxID=2728841 RepID=UPI00146C3120|nr:hypothetical protein [Pseudoflavitalea sp. G-6-1-2]NML20088.1 hypothetical protein [Pseudoflavitalea sp. G-6-1-2]